MGSDIIVENAIWRKKTTSNKRLAVVTIRACWHGPLMRTSNSEADLQPEELSRRRNGLRSARRGGLCFLIGDRSGGGRVDDDGRVLR